jgi:hypothetical protein
MARPSNFFTTLDGILVQYDRIGDDDYGNTGIDYKFYATDDFEDQLDDFIAEIRSETETLYGPLIKIFSAGAYVDKAGRHGLGRAFDLDALIWRDHKLVFDQQPVQKPLYLLVQAIATKRFGYVLGYNYDAAHKDHLHVDDGRTVKFRTNFSVTNFMQECLILFWNKDIVRDGEWGFFTKTAFQEVLDELGVSYPPNQNGWREFCDAAIDEARFMLGGNSLDGSSSDSSLLGSDADEHLASDPSLAMADEDAPSGPAIAVAHTKPAGKIDLSYSPMPGWQVKSKNGMRKTWSLSTDSFTDLYLGYDFEFKSDPPFRGLARTGQVAQSQFYDASDYRALHGPWADFIFPTGRCESEANFCVVNAWDSAGFTVGFFQMAAHTGAHMAQLFRDIWNSLPDEADQFFPELKLGHQIGKGKPDEIFAVSGGAAVSLDVLAAPSDGLAYNPKYYHGRFMDFFNERRDRVDETEIACAARWQAWVQTSPALREIVVSNAVNIARENVAALHRLVLVAKLKGYPDGLHGIGMDICAAAMDTKHHGRRNRDKGQSNHESILNSLDTKAPLNSFRFIDTGWREDRSERVVKEIRSMKTAFAGKTYDASRGTFS